MMAEPDVLKDHIAGIVDRVLPAGGAKVAVEPAEMEDGYDFLLVTITLAGAHYTDEVLERLIDDIEDGVAERDERYPSVRFQDAA